MWEAIKPILSSIKLGHFVMWLLFMLLCYTFAPVGITHFFSQKTPAYFPDWLSLSDVAFFVFSVICSWAITGLFRFVKSAYSTRKARHLLNLQQQAEEARLQQIKQYLSQLSAEEQSIVEQILQNHCAPTYIYTLNANALNALEIKGVILNVARARFSPIYQLSNLALKAIAQH